MNKPQRITVVVGLIALAFTICFPLSEYPSRLAWQQYDKEYKMWRAKPRESKFDFGPTPKYDALGPVVFWVEQDVHRRWDYTSIQGAAIILLGGAVYLAFGWGGNGHSNTS